MGNTRLGRKKNVDIRDYLHVRNIVNEIENIQTSG